MLRNFILLCLFIGFIAPIYAQEVREYTPQERTQLTYTKYALRVLDSLKTKKILPENTFIQEKTALEQQASNILKTADKAKLYKLLNAIDEEKSLNNVTVKSKSWFSQASGYFTFINLVSVIGALILVIALGFLVQQYLLDILKKIPVIVYEFLMYFACVAIIVGADWASPEIKVFIAFPGCIALFGVFIFTINYHELLVIININNEAFNKKEHKISKYERKTITNNTLVMAGCMFLTTAIWGVVAYYYQSPLIGFISVVAFYILKLISYRHYVFYNDLQIDIREKTTQNKLHILNFLLSSSLLAGFICFKIFGLLLSPFVLPFAYSMLFIGGFLYFTGLLLVSHYFYTKAFNKTYIMLQIFAVVSSVAGLYVGFLMDIMLLKNICSLFFMVYLLIKCSEINIETKRLEEVWIGFLMSIVLLGEYILLKKLALTPFLIIYFGTSPDEGILYLGSFMYFFCLFNATHVFFTKTYNAKYFAYQLFTIIASALLLYVAFLENITLLRGTGGILLVLYILAKYLEIDWAKIGYAWFLLGFGAILYATSLVVKLYPQYFFMG